MSPNTTVQGELMEPGTFDSAALHGVIHCLPGPLSRKAVAVAKNSADTHETVHSGSGMRTKSLPR